MSSRPCLRSAIRASVALGALLAACRLPPSGGIPSGRATEAELAARHAVVAEQSIRPDTFSARSLGIAPFAVGAADTALAPLAYGLADLLMTDLARSAQLRVVDRLRLDALLREVQLVEAGRVDLATAPRVGRLVGARRLIVGALANEPGGNVGIQARIADVVTGEMPSAVTASAALSDILAAEKELATRLFRELGVNLTPAEQRAVEARPTRNLTALLAYSRGVRYEVEGRYDAAAAEYRSALGIDPSFTIAGARLVDVQTRNVPADTRIAARTEQRAAQVARATTVTGDRVNGVFVSPIGGSQQTGVVTDPSYPARTAIILIFITTPP